MRKHGQIGSGTELACSLFPCLVHSSYSSRFTKERCRLLRFEAVHRCGCETWPALSTLIGTARRRILQIGTVEYSTDAIAPRPADCAHIEHAAINSINDR